MELFEFNENNRWPRLKQLDPRQEGNDCIEQVLILILSRSNTATTTSTLTVNCWNNCKKIMRIMDGHVCSSSNLDRRKDDCIKHILLRILSLPQLLERFLLIVGITI